MALTSDLISQFVKITKDDKKVKNETTVYGTVVYDDEKPYVKLDGSDLLTPISVTTNTKDGKPNVKDGDRVTVMIKDHTATVTGNMSFPFARTEEVEEISGQVSEFGTVVAHKVTADDIQAMTGYFDKLLAITADIEGIEAVTAEIETLKASFIEGETLKVDDIDAITANIESIEAKFGEFDSISTDDLNAINAEITNLKGYTADFTYISAVKASVKDLEVGKLSAKDADIKYVNVDFANIDKAWFEEFYARSSLINYVVAEDLTVTGYLVGVTIKGDLIEGGTVVADKLVIKGDDGLYYKLNTNGETVEGEQTDRNSLNGSIITAKSITAEKVRITDLVAFGATIGGFKITDDSIYSGVKASVLNTRRGVYLDNDGQFSLGDATNYLRFYNDPIYRQVVWDSEAGKYVIPENAVDYDARYMIQGPFVNDPNNSVENPPSLDADPTYFTDEGYPVYMADYADNQDFENYIPKIDFCIIPNYKLEISAESILFGANSKKSAADLEALTDYVKIKTVVDEKSGDEKPCVELSEDDSDRKHVITNTKSTFLDGDTVKTEVGADGVKTTDVNVSGTITHNNLVWAFRANGNCGLSWKEVTS